MRVLAAKDADPGWTTEGMARERLVEFHPGAREIPARHGHAVQLIGPLIVRDDDHDIRAGSGRI
jgi:hypothetical protein